MHFKHEFRLEDNAPIIINIDNIHIEQIKTFKFLGVLIDDNLTWNDQLHHVIMSISKSIGIINKLKFLLPHTTLFLLYNSLVLPYLTYCNIVWANCGATKLDPILLLQKRALRICTGSTFLAHTDPLFLKLETLKVTDVHILQVAIFMFKYINKQLPTSFNNYFCYNSTIHSYPTRISENFHLINPKLLITHKTIRHHGPDLWNNLPNIIKSRLTLYSFKATLKRHLISLNRFGTH